jgi:hypothetical protein
MPARPRRRVGRSRRNAAGSPSPGQRSFRPVRRDALRMGAAVGLSTSAAFSGDQYQSFGLAESRRRLIWWSRTVETLATVEMCPAVAAAAVERVLACRGFTGRRRQAASATNGRRRWPFDLRPVFRRSKPVVWSRRESPSPYLVGADPRQRCDDRKRPVDATCTRGEPRRKRRVRQRHLRALHGGAGEPSASSNPH